MGCVTDQDLRFPPPDPAAPHPVGRVHARTTLTATLVLDTESGPEYAAEIEIGVTLGLWYELPLPASRRLYWAGVEISLANPAYRDHRLIAALYPSRWNWFAHAPFRRTFRKSRAERAARIAGHLANGRPLRELTWDPFEQDKAFHTARLDDPFRLHRETAQDLGNGYLRGRSPGMKIPGGPLWHFGLCPPSLFARLRIPTPPPPPSTGHARIPRILPEDVDQASYWQALAGRREGDTAATFASTLAAIRDSYR